MAQIKLHVQRLEHNFRFLDSLFRNNDLQWGVVTKLLCGYKPYLEELLALGNRQVLDSRVHNLKTIAAMAPEIRASYIKPTSQSEVEHVITHTETSFNSDYRTIRLLSEEARKQGRIHKVIVMVEMGDLREGIIVDQLEDLFRRILPLRNIEVIGVGTNLKCLSGVEPTYDKMLQLAFYRRMLERKFGIRLPVVSGGTSAVVPLLLNHRVPKEINHYRVGETLFFGTDLLTDRAIQGMRTDVFELNTQIIELYEKPKVPFGKMGSNVSGESMQIDEADKGKTSYRALIDIGKLDIDPNQMIPGDRDIQVAGASSDVIAVDLGINRRGYKVGDHISWRLKYLGALSLMNSVYVEKRVEANPDVGKPAGILDEETLRIENEMEFSRVVL